MYTIEQLGSIVRQSVDDIKFNLEPQGLYAPIRHIMGTGGKRIRPVLTLAACNVFSDNIDSAIDPAIAVEVFHNFTLVHDDIMDNADIRRGVVTVHKKWNSNTAILSGDAMMVLAYSLLAKTNASLLPRVIEVFNELALGVCEGQQYDMDFESLQGVTREEYLKMIELKTAVLLAGALRIGAIIGGAEQNDIDALGSFGRNLGIAFQLQDDILDVYGDMEVFGKKIGGDIMAQKKTMLTIETLGALDYQQRSIFNSILSDDNMPRGQKIKLIMGYYQITNARQTVEAMVDDHFKTAKQALDELNVPDERKSTLRAIAELLLARKC